MVARLYDTVVSQQQTARGDPFTPRSISLSLLEVYLAEVTDAPLGLKIDAFAFVVLSVRMS